MSGRDGGPAFPRVEPASGGQGPTIYFGMTLRDYFAARAMGSIIQTWPQVRDADIHSEDDLLRITAEDAYRFADAMLAERAKGQPK